MNDRKELIEYRTLNSKSYLNADGTIEKEIYDENIHYLKDGKYEEIDNTLVANESGYTNNKNDFKVQFSECVDSELISVSLGDESISMSFKDAENISTNKSNIRKARSKNNNPSFSDNIAFKEIYKDIDVNYEIRSNKLKESIILNKLPEQDKISFIVKTDMDLTLNEDNTISIKDKDQKVFKIEKPYMFDSNNVLSQNISYSLEKVDNGYELTLNLDKEWLSDETRLYPVTIDPTITSKEDKKVIDTYIYEGDDNDTVYNTDILRIGRDIVDGKEIRSAALLKFDLPEIPTSYSVVDAKLFLVGYPDENYYAFIENPEMVCINRMTQDWQEETAKWKELHDKYDPKIENYFYSTFSPIAEDGSIEAKTSVVNITNLVQKWYTKEPNYGLMLRELRTEDQDTDNGSRYFSNDYKVTGGNPRPRLIISYRNFNGLEEYLSYTSQSHELGNSYVNNFNGNLTVTFNVANTVGGPLPASLYLVYNTADAIDKRGMNYGYGLGIKPNLIQTIEKEIIEEKEMLKYTDEDGTQHYFYKKVIDDTKEPIEYSDEFYDEDGLGLKIESKENCYIMTDKDSNTNKFVKHTLNNKDVYFLEEVKDTNNKTIKVVYDNNKISKVIDASNNEINITYEEDKISFISPYKTVIANYTDNKLTSIEDLGDTETIEYNSNNLIEKVINSNGLSIKYDYINDIVFKVSKVTEYSMNNTEGEYLEFTYNFKATKVNDRKGHIKTYTFNEYGNVESTIISDKNEELMNSYAKTSVYGEQGTNSANKIILDTNYIKHVNNIIDNSSLELIEEEDLDNLYKTNSSYINLNITDDAHYGNKALKAKTTKENEYFYSIYEVKKGKDYTYSAYIKNNVPVKMSLSYDNIEEETVIQKTNEEYNRYSVTINYPDNALSNLKIKFTLLEKGELIIDDLQLEEGQIANYFNMIYDGAYNYNRNIDDLLIKFNPDGTIIIGGENNEQRVEKVKINENCGAVKFLSSPYRFNEIRDWINVKGVAGDVFQYSFFYKNEGVSVNDDEKKWLKSSIKVIIEFYKEGIKLKDEIEESLTYWNTDWHFFSKKISSKEEFDEIRITIPITSNVNDIYLTNFSLYKDLESYSYVYDDEGNLVSSVDLSKETSQFAYNSNNQLIQATTPKGANYKFEYDDNVTDRLIRAISPSGITNAIDYDDNNNPIKTVVNNTQAFDDIMDTIYYIRARGTDDYMYINDNKTLRVKQCECSHDKFNVLLQPNGHVKLEFSIMPNYYLKDNNGALKIEYGDNNNLFELIKHTNKSYSIKSTYSNLAVTVNNDKSLSLTPYDESNANQQFLFERMESSLFIEASAKYTEDGRFIKSVKDTVGNITTYDINPVNGLINSVTTADGNITNYVYDDKFRLIKIINNTHKVEYEYDNKNNLTNIKQGLKNYKFSFDDFNRKSITKINDKILSERIYEPNNGNLSKIKYGNGSEINYSYDSYDRVKTLSKEDDIYTNYYDNLSRLARVFSGNYKNDYYYDYDFAGRISKYKHNWYETSYDYDQDNNITKKIEELVFDKYTYNYTYNNESALTNLNILNTDFNYNYDNLGRLEESNINNNYKTTYHYITRGNKTSTVIDKVNDNGIEYSYIYDSLGNIVEIKKNNVLTNKYKYDNLYQLIQDDNLVTNRTTKYSYDLNGNIIYKKQYEYNKDILLHEDKFEYADSSWQDLLTKFNDESITYDEIGNPLTIGNKELTWINGRELSTYNDGTNNISYEYDVNGIRTSKVINGNKTKYYLEESSSNKE